MRSVMTNAVAARMNFVGRGAKTGIGSMKILKVIVGKQVDITVKDLLFHAYPYLTEVFFYFSGPPELSRLIFLNSENP